MDVGPAELLIVAVVIVLLFGSRKLPELAKGLGEAKREFERASHRTSKDEPAED